MHGLGVMAGHFHLECSPSSLDAAALCVQGQGNLLGQGGDAGEFDPQWREELEADGVRGEGATVDAHGDLVAGQDHLDAVRLMFQELTLHGSSP